MLENKSVKEIISLIKTKEASIKEVVSFYLERIKKYNLSLNAIVSIKDEEQIINEAKDKDENFNESKPLFGLPLASKDLLDVVDFPTTYGFPGYKDYFPNKNSIIVDRQLDAGGIMIGKTNTAELGVGAHTANRLFGITPNIYAFKLGNLFVNSFNLVSWIGHFSSIRISNNLSLFSAKGTLSRAPGASSFLCNDLAISNSGEMT